jgi:hypothetical protein
MGKYNHLKTYLAYALSVSIAIILPPILWILKLPIIESTYIESTYDGSNPSTIDSQAFELFGFFITMIMVVATYRQVAQQSSKIFSKIVPIILPLFVFLNLLFIQLETFQIKSTDYLCYEMAAKSILAGTNPYAGNSVCYLYPPLLAQALFHTHQIIAQFPLFVDIGASKTWIIVAYIFQCFEFLQIILAYYLMYLFALKLRVQALPALLLISALFLFNYPLIRTITFDQINVWVLNSFLLGILLLNRYPVLGGMAVAFGAHIKLYTLILLLPWGLTRRWQAIWGMGLGLIAIAVIQTNWASDWKLWQQFLSYFSSPEKPSNYRNNAIWSLVFNLSKIFSRFVQADLLLTAVSIVVIGLNIAILIWFARRFLQREQIRKQSIELESQVKSQLDIFRYYGHSMDAIALSLLISPSVWEHHYVLAIPVALWAIVAGKPDNLWLVSLGIFMIFCISTFEIFPLSFHRLLGLLITIYLTAPIDTIAYFTGKVEHRWLEQHERYYG